MKRVLFIVVLALTLIFSTMTFGLAADKIVFDFPSWQATEPGFADWWNELIDEFESEHPNVEINFYQVPYKDYINTLTHHHQPYQVQHSSEFLYIHNLYFWDEVTNTGANGNPSKAGRHSSCHIHRCFTLPFI